MTWFCIETQLSNNTVMASITFFCFSCGVSFEDVAQLVHPSSFSLIYHLPYQKGFISLSLSTLSRVLILLLGKITLVYKRNLCLNHSFFEVVLGSFSF